MRISYGPVQSECACHLPALTTAHHPSAAGRTRMMASSSSADEIPPLPGTFLVIGGNRGVGLELVRHLKKRQSNVLATTRKTNDDLEVTRFLAVGSVGLSAGRVWWRGLRQNRHGLYHALCGGPASDAVVIFPTYGIRVHAWA